MSMTIRCWEVTEGEEPRALDIGGPQLEEHLEEWLERDISLVAAWPPSEVVRRSEEYFSRADWIEFGSLEDAFQARFNKSLEEVHLNAAQRVVLVGASMESGVERMVEWLSANGVDINIALFTFHRLEGKRYILARTLVLSEEVTAARSAARAGRRPPITREQFEKAEATYELEQHIRALDDLRRHPIFTEVWGVDGIDLEVEIPREEGRPLRRKAIQVLVTRSKPGTLRVGIVVANIAQRLGMPAERIESGLQEFPRDPNVRWRYEVDLRSAEEAKALAAKLLSIIEEALPQRA